jgi:hypothetical protein
VGFGFLSTTVIVGTLAGLGFYVPFWLNLLTVDLKNYQYDINTFLPADSEIVHNITEILTKRIYILAACFSIFTLIGSSNLLDRQLRAIFTFPILLLAWITITIQFLLIRSTLGWIINRTKWKTLNKIQVKINLIEATGDLSDKDTAERLLRLADIHKQIMASKTNTFDLKSVSTLFSQLMLPLLGLVLGNLEKIFTLLSK